MIIIHVYQIQKGKKLVNKMLIGYNPNKLSTIY